MEYEQLRRNIVAGEIPVSQYEKRYGMIWASLRAWESGDHTPEPRRGKTRDKVLRLMMDGRERTPADVEAVVGKKDADGRTYIGTVLRGLYEEGILDRERTRTNGFIYRAVNTEGLLI